eukprot:CAMPEP_0170945516 /NCGR_PEP_ID=MMETSP0735-20130129/26493_1 /TAXON_ID=186038 /ORGANISM="Fragilariopsis kerguelensis, Strain L26-C5" /LENGTH=540 /DNA_ID=CAMNT_0011353937 /DNA_START=91 /DNA_END=1713 /DNA_ORIENTATION=-
MTPTTTTTGGVVLFVGIIAICIMLFVMPNIITIKSVSSFSTTVPFSTRNNKSSALVGSKLFQSTSAKTTSTDDTTKKTIRPLMEPPQVDGNNMSQRMLRRLRRQRENNNYETNDKNNNDGDDEKNNQNNDTAAGGGGGGGVPIIPDPIVPYDSVRSVRLIIVDEEDEAETSLASSSSTTTATKSVRVEIGLDNNSDSTTTTSTSTTGVGLSRKIIDPRQLHQTSDFELWMTLRKQVVDVSASQLSIVLDTNFFTSRHQLLEEKITNNKQKQTQPMEDQQGDLILIGQKNNDDTSTPTMSKSNSKACAWGIKMEPIAFAQYKTIMESTTTTTNTNTNDDDDENDNANENNNNNFVEETGMYLLTHTDPVTKKTFTFGASPDGLVTEYNTTDTTTQSRSVGLLEIKSLWGRRHKETLPQFDQCPNRFYDQIQGQLAVCNKEWCDLMLFIPPTGNASSSSRSTKKGRKGKSKKKRMKQQRKAEAAGVVQHRKTKGKNYCIVRVKRNRTYWDKTVLPALIQFCQEVDTGVLVTTTTTAATPATE